MYVKETAPLDVSFYAHNSMFDNGKNDKLINEILGLYILKSTSLSFEFSILRNKISSP